MHKLLLAGIVALLTACSPATTPVKEEAAAPVEVGGEALLGPEGYGPVRVGMTLAEAGTALGHALAAEGASEDPQACQIYPDGGALYMAEQGRITRVSAVEGFGGEAIRTAAGVGVGSSDAEVRSAYPEAAEEPAKYEGPPAHDLIAWTAPNERGIRFEIDASGKVARMHAGGPSIMYVEGCS